MFDRQSAEGNDSGGLLFVFLDPGISLLGFGRVTGPVVVCAFSEINTFSVLFCYFLVFNLMDFAGRATHRNIK